MSTDRDARLSATLRAKAHAAEQARQAVHAAHRTWRQSRKARKDGAYAAYLDTLAAFRRAVAAAYPPGFDFVWAGLRTGYPDAIELAVTFLEADPWFFRSGYVKEDLIRRLKRLDLAPDVAQRLRAVCLAVVDGRDRREFRRYCRLARRLASPEFRAALAARQASTDPGVRRRARWMLAAVADDRRGQVTDP